MRKTAKHKPLRVIVPPNPFDEINAKLNRIAVNIHNDCEWLQKDISEIKTRVTKIEIGDRMEASSVTPSFREQADALLGEGKLSEAVAEHYTATGSVTGALSPKYSAANNVSTPSSDTSILLQAIERLARDNGRLQEKLVTASVHQQSAWDSLRGDFQDLKMAIGGLGNNK